MNRPGSAEGNWRWRFTDHMLSESVFQELRELTEASGRLATGAAPALAGARNPPPISVSA
jgi:4-alpha-glucanotransferase